MGQSVSKRGKQQMQRPGGKNKVGPCAIECKLHKGIHCLIYFSIPSTLMESLKQENVSQYLRNA